MAVAVLCQGAGEFFQSGGVDPALVEGNFFGASHHKALAFLQGGYKACCFQQAVVRAGVEPSVATTHDFNVQLAHLQVAFVDVGDFQLATGRWLDVCRYVTHLAVEKYRPVKA